MATKRVIGIDIGSKYIKIICEKGRKHGVVRPFVSTADSVVDGECGYCDADQGALFERNSRRQALFSINANSVVTGNKASGTEGKRKSTRR